MFNINLIYYSVEELNLVRYYSYVNKLYTEHTS